MRPPPPGGVYTGSQLGSFQRGSLFYDPRSPSKKPRVEAGSSTASATTPAGTSRSAPSPRASRTTFVAWRVRMNGHRAVATCVAALQSRRRRGFPTSAPPRRNHGVAAAFRRRRDAASRPRRRRGFPASASPRPVPPADAGAPRAPPSRRARRGTPGPRRRQNRRGSASGPTLCARTRASTVARSSIPRSREMRPWRRRSRTCGRRPRSATSGAAVRFRSGRRMSSGSKNTAPLPRMISAACARSRDGAKKSSSSHVAITSPRALDTHALRFAPNRQRWICEGRSRRTQTSSSSSHASPSHAATSESSAINTSRRLRG